MKRVATLMKLKPGAEDEYCRLHQEIWPEVVEANHNANVRNYSIFKAGDYLFSYYEYIGDDFEADIAKKNASPAVKAWQETTGGLRESVDGDAKVMNIKEIWHEEF